MKNVLHILDSFGIGGVECLCKDIAIKSHLNNYFITVHSSGVIGEELTKSGYHVINIGKSNLHFFVIIQKILTFCELHKIDVIVLHQPIILLYMVLPYLKNRLKQTKIVLYFHCNACYLHGIKDRLFFNIKKKIVKMAIIHADKVIAVSNSVKISIYEYYNVKRNIDVMYNGIDIGKFKPRSI